MTKPTDNVPKTPTNNVIDMTDRVTPPDPRARLKSLKVRLDLEQAKIAVSTSLLSIVVLVSLANNSLLTPSARPAEGGMKASRGIASLPSAHEEFVPSAEVSPRVVNELAKRSLSASASIGQKPSGLESLAFGTLEGKYAVRLENGKISEIEHSSSGEPKKIANIAGFLDAQRAVFPVAFEKSLKVGSEKAGEDTVETYELLSRVSRPLAKVQVKTDSEGRLLLLRVATTQDLVSSK